MATDPFVAPKLEDAPRQEQNLSPGVHYPPADAWRPQRAGDLRSGQPTGMFLGAPGPNIGFARKLARGRADTIRLAPHESLDDALAVVAELAMRRSGTFPRAPVVHDVDFAVRLLGYDREGSAASEWRKAAVDGAAEDWPRRRVIVDAVPDELLRASLPDLEAHLAEYQEELRAAVLGVVEESHRTERAEGA